MCEGYRECSSVNKLQTEQSWHCCGFISPLWGILILKQTTNEFLDPIKTCSVLNCVKDQDNTM